MCSEENLKAMFTRVQKKNAEQDKIAPICHQSKHLFIIYNFMGKFNIKKKKVYLSTVILKGKLMFF